MIINYNPVAIIADDLTGANDSALQFYLQGAKTQIILSENIAPDNVDNTQVWAVTTETRNSSAQTAYQKVSAASKLLTEKLSTDYFFKKIDSTIRGNIAVEVLTVLNELGWDATVVVPAFPDEQRITVGGYHLLRSMPIERTEVSHDPKAPICESYLPNLFASQLDEEYEHLIAHIELNTVMKGAGPILVKINELINSGKKLIIADAVSNTDIEQIALAINKTDKKILPAGTAAFASALAKLWFGDSGEEFIRPDLPDIPKCIIAGSATDLCAKQVTELKKNNCFENFKEYDLKFADIHSGVNENLLADIVENIKSGKNILIHSINLKDNLSQNYIDDIENDNMSFPSLITEYLSNLAFKISQNARVLFIFVGGETAYKACIKTGANKLSLKARVTGAIPLCLASNGQWIVTKSGNLGNPQTLIEVMKYFEK